MPSPAARTPARMSAKFFSSRRYGRQPARNPIARLLRSWFSSPAQPSVDSSRRCRATRSSAPRCREGLPRGRSMVLARVDIERRRLPEPVERVEQPDRVDRVGADILVLRSWYISSAPVMLLAWSSGDIDRYTSAPPEIAALALEAVRRERAVVHAVARDPRLEERRVHHRVHRRERAVAVAADGQPRAVRSPRDRARR